ncbi:hypothetical protein ACLRGI_18630 [Paenarthrobacter nitroguajacolicus]
MTSQHAIGVVILVFAAPVAGSLAGIVVASLERRRARQLKTVRP